MNWRRCPNGEMISTLERGLTIKAQRRRVFVGCLYCPWERELEDTIYHLEDGVRELWKEAHPVVSEVRCVACRRPAIFSRELDRFVHIDGSDNRPCWVEITSGRADWKINKYAAKEAL